VIQERQHQQQHENQQVIQEQQLQQQHENLQVVRERQHQQQHEKQQVVQERLVRRLLPKNENRRHHCRYRLKMFIQQRAYI
jgi:hypothetical protein